ncbi:YqcI/YcgG family protein [Erwinia mallotivora]|uniref:YqcI/YcgG family protein n=1 Tax=Erwinia mallotivora TaxID=69222 RepID=UPI0035EF22EF
MEDRLLSNGAILRQTDLMMLHRVIVGARARKGWRLDGFSDIADKLEDRHFPCLFARHAWKSESLLFGFISRQQASSEMLSVMNLFIRRTQTLPEEQRLYSPLILIFEQNEFSSLDEAHRFAWQQLQMLHDHDARPWPEHIPTSPDESAWSFCFGGTELFINISCPGHARLRSRNLGERVVFVINPRPHFDILASHRDPKGIKIREKIRARVSDYNQGYVPGELGFYGDDGSLEWKQYQLNEPGSASFSGCPLHIHKERKLQ